MAKKELVVAPSEQALEALRQNYPTEQGFTRIQLPRISMASQDKTEGKGKAMKVVAEAGTFFTERQGEEEDENGKKMWEKDEIGKEIEVVILYQRKQLRMYDENTELYTSSSVYDNEDDIVPLFSDKKQVDKGTPAELKAKYAYKAEDGKTKSKLEDNRILYMLYEDEMYQMTLRGSSMYAFMTFARKTLPPAYLVELSSEAKEKGSIEWNQMTFKVVRPLNATEVADVTEKVKEIQDGIAQEKGYYASQTVVKEEDKIATDKKFNDF